MKTMDYNLQRRGEGPSQENIQLKEHTTEKTLAGFRSCYVL